MEQQSLRDKVKIMVGGIPSTEVFTKEIADAGYAPSAPGAVKLAKQLLIILS